MRQGTLSDVDTTQAPGQPNPAPAPSDDELDTFGVAARPDGLTRQENAATSDLLQCLRHDVDEAARIPLLRRLVPTHVRERLGGNLGALTPVLLTGSSQPDAVLGLAHGSGRVRAEVVVEAKRGAATNNPGLDTVAGLPRLPGRYADTSTYPHPAGDPGWHDLGPDPCPCGAAFHTQGRKGDQKVRGGVTQWDLYRLWDWTGPTEVLLDDPDHVGWVALIDAPRPRPPYAGSTSAAEWQTVRYADVAADAWAVLRTHPDLDQRSQQALGSFLRALNAPRAERVWYSYAQDGSNLAAKQYLASAVEETARALAAGQQRWTGHRDRDSVLEHRADGTCRIVPWAQSSVSEDERKAWLRDADAAGLVVG